MGTYIALHSDPRYKEFWRATESHLRVISAFDPGLEVHVVQPSAKTLLGANLKEITYAPTNLKHEGRKLLHSVINYVSVAADVLINPVMDEQKYDVPEEVAKFREEFSWVSPEHSDFFYLVEFGGGLTVSRIDPTIGSVWAIDYDCQESPRYEVPTLTAGPPIVLTRPEILFHELVHVDMDGDPLPRFPEAGAILSYDFKEGLAALRENGFRISNNPRLKASQLRSTIDHSVSHYYE
jgi:hypothetical protein